MGRPHDEAVGAGGVYSDHDEQHKRMTYRTTFHTGPLRGRTVSVVAADDWQAAKQIADALGQDAMNCAGWPVYHDTGTLDLFGLAPVVETITLDQALEVLNR